MSSLLFFLVLDIALVIAAVVLLLAVIVRRGRSPAYLGLAALLIVLALGIWYVAFRTPLVLP
jgi:ABC-type proline/glycine betaine transport system permease subunit